MDLEPEQNRPAILVHEQNPVSKAVWPWQEPGQAGKGNAVQARRVRAGLQFAGMLAVSCVFYLMDRWAGARTLPASVFVFCLALFALISGLVAPALFDVFDRFLRGLGKVVGVALAWLLLAPFFLLIFAPAGVFLILRGKDPMKRDFRSSDTTFWIKREARKTPETYRKQYG